MRLRTLVRHWIHETVMFKIIFFTLVASVLADSSSSQGHIKYSDDNGSKVDWKLYAPYSQFKSHLAAQIQRRNGVKSSSEQSQIARPVRVESPVGVSAKIMEPRYKPFSQVPHHLKQLLTQSYEPQLPHVDPDAFFHQIPEYSWGEVIRPVKSQSMDYQSKTYLTKMRDQDRREKVKPSFGMKEEEIQPEKTDLPAPPLLSHRPLQSLNFDKSVPVEIQQLLQYQAQIPYNVIANHIVYKPETPFVPEPIPKDETGPYQYRSKIYYAVKNNNVQKKTAMEDQYNDE